MLLAATVTQVAASELVVEAPAGFQLVSASTGVQLYRKNYPKGSPDFVQVVDLSQGAAIELFHGDVVDTRLGEGVFGGDDPKLLSQTLQDYWDDLVANAPNAFCITNGQFFNIQEYPTRLPFPLKVDGVILSDGYAAREFEGQKLILELWPDHADISLLTQATLYLSSAPDILGGLHEEARKSPDKPVGRTFVGVADADQDGRYESLLIFNTQSATQAAAAEVLRSFGAAKVMMLDGGGSTQLICRDKALISSERLIPQAIGILAGQALTVEVTATITPTLTAAVPMLPSPSPSSAAGQSLATSTEVSASATPVHSRTPMITEGNTATQVTQADASTPGVRVSDAVVIPVIALLLAPALYLVVRRVQRRQAAPLEESGDSSDEASTEGDSGEAP